MKPKITVDVHEPDNLIEHLEKECAKHDIVLKKKALKVGDFEITDKNGKRWGIERKTANDCFISIITKTSDGKTGRIYDQLTRLLAEYGDGAVFLLENPKYVYGGKKGDRNIPIYKKYQMVYTFFSERSFLMPTIMTKDSAHTAFLIAKLATILHSMRIIGRDIAVERKT